MVLPSFVRRWMNGKAFASPRARQTATWFARRRVCLHLEALEDRSVPSTVMNLSDHDPGSLRDAIATTPAGGTVNFQSGLSGTITLTGGELAIGKNLTIAGPGASVITVSGNHASRVFDIAATETVTISGLTITDGSVTGANSGGGVLNSGTLAIASAILSGNSATGSSATGGGGIANTGTLTVTSSTLSGNYSVENGGGIWNQLNGTLTVTASTLSGNSAGTGGGIWNVGTLTVTNSTLSGNSAGSGGGIENAVGTLTVTASTLTGNSAVSGGGGINNSSNGRLTITASTLSGNSATGGIDVPGIGGGIYNTSPQGVTLTSSTLSGNSASVEGGGIFNAVNGMVTVTASTLSGNSASSLGGGIYSDSSTVILANSTLSGNSATYGGGIYNSGLDSTLTVTSCTLSGNSASSLGGGIYSGAGLIALRNTILAGNTAPTGPDVDGILNSQGHNLIGDGSGGSGFVATDLVGTSASPVDPKLGPLQDNGGPTQTMALLPGSPAIGAGDPTGAPLYDQRGPGFPRVVNGKIDIGAFEVQPALTVQCSVTTSVLWPPNNQLVNVGLSVQVSDPNATISVQVFADDSASPADAADLAPGQLRLRADRQGDGSGRVYLIVVTATDAFGDTASSVCTVVVPHDQSADALAAVEQRAVDAAAYFLAFHTAPPGYRPLG
jgi:hypothetical protein